MIEQFCAPGRRVSVQCEDRAHHTIYVWEGPGWFWALYSQTARKLVASGRAATIEAAAEQVGDRLTPAAAE